MTTTYLTLSQNTETPAAVLSTLSEACATLGVEKFDVYGDFTLSPDESWLRTFEKEVATYFGKADAIFLPSGTMAQAIMLKIAENKKTTSSSRFVCHYSSHIVIHENRSYSTLLQLDPIIIPPKDDEIVQQPLRYQDIAAILDSDTDKPFAVVLEIPHRELGGKCTPLEDIVAMSAHCRRRGIHFHMDGARIWEASAASSYATTADARTNARELASLFESIYISFYKGLGAVTGAMLLGSEEFIQEARIWERRFGGNLYSLLPYGVSCWHQFTRVDKNDFFARKAALVTVVDALRKRFIINQPDPKIRFEPPVPEVCLIHVFLQANVANCMRARDLTIKETGISCFARVREATIGATRGQSYFEFNMVGLPYTYANDTATS
jgi:threonine aldolase